MAPNGYRLGPSECLILTQTGQSGMDSSVVELDQALGRRQRRMVGMKWDWKMIFPPEKARP
jgi:hypothetical protein